MANTHDEIQAILKLKPSQTSVSIRNLHMQSTEEREKVQKASEYNCFAFPSMMLACDFLSDSGSSAMTDLQWSSLLRGDDSIRSHGYYALLEAVRNTFEVSPHVDFENSFAAKVLAGAKWDMKEFKQGTQGCFTNFGRDQIERPNMFLVPQGRCAENLFFGTLNEIWTEEKVAGPWIVPSNGFFDTTEAQAHCNKFHPLNLFAPYFHDAFDVKDLETKNPFKGNIDIPRLREVIAKEGAAKIPIVLMTITNNTGAGQPVSMKNMRETFEICHGAGIPVVFDAARFAENAYFIKEFEEGYNKKSVSDITKEMFSYCDAFTMSAKKDGLCNMGGMLCFRDRGLLHKRFSSKKDLGLVLREKQIVCYGSDSFGSMSGRDILALACGLYQIVNEDYLARRIQQLRDLARSLVSKGVEGVVLPTGGHAVYIDMDVFFKGTNMKIDDFGGVGLVIELIRLYGIRVCELGAFAFEWDQKNDEQRKGIINLVRIAVPRNLYNETHFNYTSDAIGFLYKNREKIPKVRVSRGAELHLRHFQSGLEPTYHNGKL